MPITMIKYARSTPPSSSQAIKRRLFTNQREVQHAKKCVPQAELGHEQKVPQNVRSVMAGEPACMARELPHLRQRWQPAHCWVRSSVSQATVPELNYLPS